MNTEPRYKDKSPTELKVQCNNYTMSRIQPFRSLDRKLSLIFNPLQKILAQTPPESFKFINATWPANRIFTNRLAFKRIVHVSKKVNFFYNQTSNFIILAD